MGGSESKHRNAHIHVQMHTHTHARTHACTHTHTHTHTHMHTCTRAHTHTQLMSPVVTPDSTQHLNSKPQAYAATMYFVHVPVLGRFV